MSIPSMNASLPTARKVDLSSNPIGPFGSILTTVDDSAVTRTWPSPTMIELLEAPAKETRGRRSITGESKNTKRGRNLEG